MARRLHLLFASGLAGLLLAAPSAQAGPPEGPPETIGSVFLYSEALTQPYFSDDVVFAPDGTAAYAISSATAPEGELEGLNVQIAVTGDADPFVEATITVTNPQASPADVTVQISLPTVAYNSPGQMHLTGTATVSDTGGAAGATVTPLGDGNFDLIPDHLFTGNPYSNDRFNPPFVFSAGDPVALLGGSAPLSEGTTDFDSGPLAVEPATMLNAITGDWNGLGLVTHYQLSAGDTFALTMRLEFTSGGGGGGGGGGGSTDAPDGEWSSDDLAPGVDPMAYGFELDVAGGLQTTIAMVDVPKDKRGKKTKPAVGLLQEATQDGASGFALQNDFLLGEKWKFRGTYVLPDPTMTGIRIGSTAGIEFEWPPYSIGGGVPDDFVFVGVTYDIGAWRGFVNVNGENQPGTVDFKPKGPVSVDVQATYKFPNLKLKMRTLRQRKWRKLGTIMIPDTAKSASWGVGAFDVDDGAQVFSTNIRIDGEVGSPDLRSLVAKLNECLELELSAVRKLDQGKFAKGGKKLDKAIDCLQGEIVKDPETGEPVLDKDGKPVREGGLIHDVGTARQGGSLPRSVDVGGVLSALEVAAYADNAVLLGLTSSDPPEFGEDEKATLQQATRAKAAVLQELGRGYTQ